MIKLEDITYESWVLMFREVNWVFVELYDKVVGHGYVIGMKEFRDLLFCKFPDLEYEMVCRKDAVYERELHILAHSDNELVRMKAIDVYSSGNVVSREIGKGKENTVRIVRIGSGGGQVFGGGVGYKSLGIGDVSND